MTAHEVIDQIKALPAPERAKVLDFVHSMDAESAPVSLADDLAFKKAADWVFGEHVDLMRKLSQ